MILTRDPVDSEESTSDADLFQEIVPSLPTTNQPDINSTASDTDAESDLDYTDETYLDDVALDEDLEDEDSGSEDDEDDGREPEVTPVGGMADEASDTDGCAPADEMDVDETDVDEMDIDKTDVDEMDVDEQFNKPTACHEGHKTPDPFRAGCAWTRWDWSCAYDVLFMVFFYVYWLSSLRWRRDWRQQSPEWTIWLADCFDVLLGALDSSDHSPEELSTLFSSFRDQFRRRLSDHDPQRFPCTGQVPASVCAILELLFGSIHGPGIDEQLVCTACGGTSSRSHHFPLLALPTSHRNLRLETDPRFLPSATLVARFIESLTIPPTPSLCAGCLHETAQAQHLSMENFPWIWFEVRARSDSAMSPSLTLPIETSGQRLTYNLAAIIYLGSNHFHWGQGVKYPAGTLRRHSVHRHKVITMCPPIKNCPHFE